MRLKLIAAGTRLPGWLNSGFEEYARRFPPHCRLELTEIPLGKRGKNQPAAKAVAQEGERMLAALKPNDKVVALVVDGKRLTTARLAARLSDWLGGGSDVAFLIGGPDGLSLACQQRAQGTWSLSDLTLPHALARLVVAEALYRSLSVVQGHPYHRE